MWVVSGIKRKYLREGVPEYPKRYGDGYRLADPVHGSNNKHKAEFEVPAETLEEAAYKIRKNGFHLRMGNDEKRDSLICPEHLIIEYRFAPFKALKIWFHRLMKSFSR